MGSGEPSTEPRLSPEQSSEVHELFALEATELSKYARSMPGSEWCGPDDLVQITFRDAIMAWDMFSQLTKDARRRWLRRVLKNKSIDHWRKYAVVDVTSDMPESGPGPADPSDIAELSIALEQCWQEITRMPRTRQRVAFLIWIENWSTARIAHHLGITQSTVRGHVREARNQLRSSVGHLVPFIDDEEED